MSNLLLSDVEARAERRRTRTREDMWQDLVQQTWRQAKAADDPADKRRLLERAHRLLPHDGLIATTLAGLLLEAGDWAGAAGLFEAVCRTHGIAEGWAGLATCRHLLGDAPAARTALAQLLQRRTPDQTIRTLADAVAPEGWCGLSTDGVLSASPGRPQATIIDGVPQRLRWTAGRARLAPSWRQAGTLSVNLSAGQALGSPLPLRVFAGAEGFVEAEAGGVAGWAWCPADPSRDPVLRLQGPLGQLSLTATEPAAFSPAMRPLARPRRFALSRAEIDALGTPLAVRGPDGRHLLGSPLDPGIEARAAIGAAAWAPVWADVVGRQPEVAKIRPRADVVIPVYRGATETLACIGSVLASVPRGTRVIVVDDASPDAELVTALQALARRRRITLLRMPENTGFPGAANAGLRAASGRDAVLLNSDTLVPPGWLERLRAAAYSAPDIGTATPLTNDGTIVSYPDPAGGNTAPDLAGTIAMDRLAQAANALEVTDIPVGVGFCLYLRRDCLDQVGLLREDVFAQGYGEENDLCLRARHHGWRNVAALDVYVAHLGATSFGDARAHLIRRNAAILERLHPGYGTLIETHLRTDPLLPARRRLDLARWSAARARSSTAVLMVTHAGGGGVDRVIEHRARQARLAGHRAIVLRPWRSIDGRTWVRLDDQVGQTRSGPATLNLAFTLPEEWPGLLRLLRAEKPAVLELHHRLGHAAEITELASRLGIPLVSVVHDYARFCPRITLVSTERRYCGEPDLAGCEACIADLGSLLEDDPPVPVLLAQSAAELQAAARVVAPSIDAASRMRRHFPGIVTTVEPWGDDASLPSIDPAPQRSRRRVLIVGAIGIEKGYEVLLACARDARRRDLPIEFVVVGFTADDERLMQAGPVHVTGEYAEADATALLRAQAGQVAFIPSVWPETWCFALSRAWEAGLAAAVFDLGAQAERVRQTGRGWLLPLGLPAGRVNDALLRLAPAQPTGQSPPQF
ncbi:MAG: glycosyltransferase [Janthinobacterium lividum]